MLPPIVYKTHPKIMELRQQKKRRKQILEQTRLKQIQDRDKLCQDRQKYKQENKYNIDEKKKNIFEKKLISRNRIYQQDKQRAIKIAEKKTNRLIQILPERKQLIDSLRNQYLDCIRSQNAEKKEQLRQIIDERIMKRNVKEQNGHNKLQYIKCKKLIDTNEGICVICLTSQANIYMCECLHLIACKYCEFILRIQKKCPLCRCISKYKKF